MGQIALYSQDTGVPVVLVPTPGALAEYTATEIALKDTPTGKPFWLVDAEDVPKDYTFFNAWELDLEALGEPDGYGMDYEDWVLEYKK